MKFTPTNTFFVSRKKTKSFLNNVFPGMDIELRVEEFLNLHAFRFLKNIIDHSCFMVKYRKGKILQGKDLRLVFFKSINKSFLELGSWIKPILNSKKNKNKNNTKKKKRVKSV
mmetsp:Transcript_8011/g.15947  ORF Transcript_8011/g.15947 Transcript_8011/m.15947 type:complete len:113 (-) Transcript_8011:1371-1709(-)